MSASRLLAGVGAEPLSHHEHRELHGPTIRFHGGELRSQLAAAGLRGRGGGAFPLAAKIDAVARHRRRPVLVANGCEGEPLGSKDRVLLQLAPHLVIDGALAVGDVIGAERILLAVEERDELSAERLRDALAERARRSARRPEVLLVPPGYVTGQESALVNWASGRAPKPSLVPPRVSDRGLDGRPTLVSNTETLAHAALIARHGARWFREVGTPEDPGTALVTLAGAVAAPGVYEVELGTTLVDLVRGAGGPTARVRGVLIGGYAGTWIGPAQIRAQRLCQLAAPHAGPRLGAGIVVLLPDDACPVAENARVADWMARQSTGQCGPCVHGLAAIAGAFEAVRSGRDGRAALADIVRWIAQIPGRGACAHPDGAVALISSAVRVFRDALLDHADHGPCEACEQVPVLPTPSMRLLGTRG